MAAHAGAPGGAPASTFHNGDGEVKKGDQAGGMPALGTVAKSVDAARRDGRRRRNRLLDKAAELLPHERVQHCGRTPAGSMVAVVRTGAGAARFHGLQVCGSVWHCPICSRTVSAIRRDELNRLLKWGRSKKLVPVLLTLTGRHRREDRLDALMLAMKGAKQRFHQSRLWRSVQGIAGHVTATELTYGRHGWHVHFHCLLLIEARSEDAAITALSGCRTAWETALNRVGLDCNDHGFDLQGAGNAGDYVAKWGAAEELALSGEKVARDKEKGRTVWQLLAEAAEGDERAARRWQEYALAFKGRRQLVWSKGLKAKADINERTDEEIAAMAEEIGLHEPGEEVGRLTREEWRMLVHQGLRITMLEAVERDGREGYERLLAQARKCAHIRE